MRTLMQLLVAFCNSNDETSKMIMCAALQATYSYPYCSLACALLN